MANVGTKKSVAKTTPKAASAPAKPKASNPTPLKNPAQESNSAAKPKIAASNDDVKLSAEAESFAPENNPKADRADQSKADAVANAFSDSFTETPPNKVDNAKSAEPPKLAEGEVGVQKEGRILTPESRPGDENRPSVIVADEFGTPLNDEGKRIGFDVNGDGEGDISHGALSANALYNDGFNVKGYDMSSQNGEAMEPFKDLSKDLKDGKLGPKGTPVQMSFGQDFDMKKLGDQLGLDITPDNVKQLGPEIQQKLRDQLETKGEDAFKHFPREQVETEVGLMDFVDKAQELGHPVVAAGANQVGTFSPAYLGADKLSAGVDENKEPIHGIVFEKDKEGNDVAVPRSGGGERHNLTIDAPGVFKPKNVNGPNGEFQGVSTNGDSTKPEVSPSMLSGSTKEASQERIEGSSFAPPFLIRWAEQTGEYFPETPPLTSFPERSGVPQFDRAN